MELLFFTKHSEPYSGKKTRNYRTTFSLRTLQVLFYFCSTKFVHCDIFKIKFATNMLLEMQKTSNIGNLGTIYEDYLIKLYCIRKKKCKIKSHLETADNILFFIFALQYFFSGHY